MNKISNFQNNNQKLQKNSTQNSPKNSLFHSSSPFTPTQSSIQKKTDKQNMAT
jgi:hypothetical protein